MELLEAFWFLRRWCALYVFPEMVEDEKRTLEKINVLTRKIESMEIQINHYKKDAVTYNTKVIELDLAIENIARMYQGLESIPTDDPLFGFVQDFKDNNLGSY